MYIVIPEIVEKCINKLNHCGFEAFIVGGCVRDSLMERKPNDWDICTNASPQNIKDIFSEYKIIDIGIEHGTVAIIMEDETMEITTYRIESEYKDNRRPKSVKFTKNIEEDLSRRDFTINAMAYNHHSGLVDLFEGEYHIKKKIIKCVGDPHKRFQEDALRIMRALRFAAQLNYSIEVDTLKGINDSKHLLKNISVERIREELNKLILADNPQKIIDLIFKLNIFCTVIDFMHNIDLKVDKTRDFSEVCGQIIEKSPKDLSIRLCILLIYIIDKYGLEEQLNEGPISISEKILRALKYDKITTKEVIILITYYNKNISCDNITIKRLLGTVSLYMTEKIIDMKSSIDYNFSEEKYRDILKEIEKNRECYTIKDLKINGRDLISLGVNEGKTIGEILNKLLEIVIERPDINEKHKLIERAQNIIKSN